jgi:DNA-directed RNA polymerase specialized sigma subunit
MRIHLSPALVTGVKNKEHKAIIQAISELIPLADHITRCYAKKFPYKKDDIRSVAYAALTSAVNKCKHDNIPAYSKLYIEGHIRNFLKSDYVFAPNRNYQDQKRKVDDSWQMPEVLSLDNEDWIETAKQQDDKDLFGFYEFCFSRLLLSPMEARVLRYAREGRTNVDIALMLDVSHTIVNRVKTELYRRFNLLRANKAIKELYFGKHN